MNKEAVKHGLLFLDVDHFKQVNVVRWGGEEFVVLLRHVTTAETQSIAEKLRALVERSHLPIGESLLRVTVSIGATLLRSDDGLEIAIRRADDLMYRSKPGGRNQVSF